MNVISPPDFAELGAEDKLIFLAGPMKGSAEPEEGVGWQFAAAEIIHDLDPRLWIATPRQYEGFSAHTNFELGDQVRWESHHLARAAFHGVQLYWYAEQGEEVSRKNSDFVRPYAKTTNKELFEWVTKKITCPAINICLGAHPRTSTLGYEGARFGWDLPALPQLQHSLDELCAQAVELAQQAEPLNDYPFWTPDSPYKIAS